MNTTTPHPPMLEGVVSGLVFSLLGIALVLGSLKLFIALTPGWTSSGSSPTGISPSPSSPPPSCSA